MCKNLFNVKIAELDFQTNLSIATGYKSLYFPSLVLFKNGKKEIEYLGKIDTKSLMIFLNHYIKTKNEIISKL